MNRELLVFKFGSSVLNALDLSSLSNLCQTIVGYHAKYNIAIISSGAVAFGKPYIVSSSNSTVLEKRTAASIGNISLFSTYQKIFASKKTIIAQALLERHHFSNRESFLRLRSTLEKLWENRVIPIINENDVVSDYEMKFSDNDELAMLIATCFSAKKLFIGTNVNGVLDKNGHTIKEITSFDKKIIYQWIDDYPEKKSTSGLGGMLSKLGCAKIACGLGTEVIIFNATIPSNLETYLKGHATICRAKKRSVSLKRKWIATSSLASPAKLFIDQNAALSLAQRKNLLIVGINRIVGNFTKGDYIRLFSLDKKEIGVARVRYSSTKLEEMLDAPVKKRSLSISNANEIIIYNYDS